MIEKQTTDINEIVLSIQEASNLSLSILNPHADQIRGEEIEDFVSKYVEGNKYG